MHTKGTLLSLVLLAVMAATALAQTPTGTLSGRVDDGTASLPGVTVTITSASLQGARNATTSVNGDYIFRFLPPGEYHLRFELQGFQTQDTTVRISSSQSSTINATMPAASVAEEVTVVGSYDTISTSTQAAATMTYDLANKLPVTGTLLSYMALAPGVNTTGPGGNYTISGAQSWENLITVNGVSIQDNVRLTPSNLFIEDAVEETTTQSAAISAEYGRFSGGVVNMLTKSGGNEMHGSLRLGLDTGAFDSRGVLRGGKWEEREALRAGSMDDTINSTYMATLGGYIWKDRLWYFASGRSRRTEGSNQTSVTNIPFTQVTEDKRYEAKLTASLNANHRLVGSYLENDTTQGNNYYTSARAMDLASLYDRELPSDLLSVHYTGVLTDNLFIEAQYSKKTFAFVGSGSRFTDRIYGTLMVDQARGSSPSYRWWSPTFCGVCDKEERNNQEYLLKGSYFYSSESLGTHDLVVGYDSFDDQRYVNNYQSGSNFRIYHTSTIIRDNVIYPVISTSNTFIRWTPIFSLAKQTHFKTNSAFINDKWRLNNYLTFNIGVRYDKNDGKDSDGKVVAKDANYSPRLGVSWDVKADGDVVFNASYASYVSAIAGGVAGGTAVGGQPGTIDFLYEGPEINMNPDGSLVDAATAIGQVFAWFDSVGGTNLETNPYVDSVSIPGATTVIKDSLDSTGASEFTIGATKRLGSKGMVRLDYVNRTFDNFYVTQTDMTTGTVTTPDGTFDKGYLINDDSLLERTYQALQLQASYRPTDWLNLGGNYTLSKAEGNLDGENATSGPITSAVRNYPEYIRTSWYAPTGYLSIDQRHRARIWAVADVISGKRNRLSVSLLESYLSGTPYSASGNIDLRGYVTNPGYITPPTYTTYFFSRRGAYRTDTVTQTDISIDYSFKVPALGADLELFVQPRVINAFNEDAVINPNYAVWTSRNAGKGLTKFDPFNSTPQECTQYSANGMTCTGTGNWMKANTFGKPIAVDDFQPPRTFTISFGVRF